MRELPTVPTGTVSPVLGSMILFSMLGSGRPIVLALSSTLSVVPVCAATGEHSVWPNTIVKGAPSFSSSCRTSAAGTVEPPEQIALTDERSVAAKVRVLQHRDQHGGNAEHRIAPIGPEHFEHQSGLERLDQHLGGGLRDRPDHAADAAAGVKQRHRGDEDVAGIDAHAVGGVGAVVEEVRDGGAGRPSESPWCPTCTGS